MRPSVDKRQVVRNMVTNLVVLAVYSVATLLFTPYLIHRIGLEAYGLVPLAMSLSTYVGVLTVGIQTAVGRYLTVEVARGDEEMASRVYTTAVTTGLALILLVTPVMLLLAFASPNIFTVPVGMEDASRWFFGFAMLSYVFVVAREVIGSAVFSMNRMDLQNAGRLLEILIRVLLPVIAFELAGPDLRVVGLGMFVGAFVSLLATVWSWRWCAPAVRLGTSLFDRTRLREMMTTGGWVTVSHVGSLLHMSTDVVVINLILGSTIAGAYGSALQLSSFLRSLAGALASVVAPVLFGQYARGRLDALGATAVQTVKLLGLALGLPVALIVGLSRPVLGLWLGPELEVIAPVLAVMMIHLTLNYAVLPLESVYMAFDRMKWPALVSVSTGVLNVVLSIVLARVGGWAIGVAAATVISLSLKNLTFSPLYSAHILGIKARGFFKSAALGGALTVAVAGLVYGLDRATVIDSWGGLVISSAAGAVVYIAVAAFALTPQDRALLRSMIPGLSRQVL